MRPVDQDKFGMPDGNCFAACVATIFGLELTAVPHFMTLDDWFPAFRAWSIAVLGHEPVCVTASDAPDSWIRKLVAPCIVSGRAARGLDHSTVWEKGAPAHDPHPSRAGLLTVDDVIVFVSVSPARAVSP